jgi:hypothetical protein
MGKLLLAQGRKEDGLTWHLYMCVYIYIYIYIYICMQLITNRIQIYRMNIGRSRISAIHIQVQFNAESSDGRDSCQCFL